MTQSQATARDFWTMATIIVTVTRTLGVDRDEFRGNGRRPLCVLARALVASLARASTNLSYPEIAREMGRPSHSAVIASERRWIRMANAEQPITIDLGGKIITLRQLRDHVVSVMAVPSKGAA